MNPSLSALEQNDEFIARHIGPCPTEIAAMLAAIGADTLDQLINETVPAAIRLPADLPLPAPKREHEALATLKTIASKNVVNKSCIGMGYYDTLTPKVILRKTRVGTPPTRPIRQKLPRAGWKPCSTISKWSST